VSSCTGIGELVEVLLTDDGDVDDDGCRVVEFDKDVVAEGAVFVELEEEGMATVVVETTGNGGDACVPESGRVFESAAFEDFFGGSGGGGEDGGDTVADDGLRSAFGGKGGAAVVLLLTTADVCFACSGSVN
jgi:hypothetical protein